MKLSTITATLGLGLILFGSLPALAASGQGDLTRLRVSVFNSSPISASIIEQAERQAGRVFRDVGVDVIWLNCPQDASHEASLGRCSEVSFPFHLHLGILRVSRGLKGSTIGISFSAEDGRGCYADLFYEPIRQLEEETSVALSVILGHAMAHELGHLMLGINSHSPSGLMRAHWTREDLTNASRGNLRFSLEQSLRIINRLTPREPQGRQTTEIAAVMAGAAN
jgi:hypothetical protein